MELVISISNSTNNQKINSLVLEGKIIEAIEELEKIEKEQKKVNERIRCRILRSKNLIKIGALEKAFSLIQNSIDDLQETQKKGLLIDSLLVKAEILQYFGEYNKSQEVIEKSMNILKELQKERHLKHKSREASILYQKGCQFFLEGNLDKSISVFERSLKLYEQLDNKQNIANTLGNIGVSYTIKGDHNRSFDYYQQSMKIREEIGDKTGLAESYRNYGVYYHHKEEFHLSFEFLRKGLALREEMGDQIGIAQTLNTLGVVKGKTGDIKGALDDFIKSLAISEEIGNVQDTPTSLLSIGIIYTKMGELDKALEYYQASSKIYEELENELSLAWLYTNIGETYRKKDNAELAIDYFSKGLEIFENIGDNYYKVWILFHLICTYIDVNSLEKANKLLDEIEQINRKEDSKYINHLFILSKALILKTSTRVRSRVEAGELFEQILSEEGVDNELKVVALLCLFELLISEFSHYGNQEVLREAHLLSSNLIKIAKMQNSYLLFTESYWLQAQLAIVQYDFNVARHLLTQAQIIAEEKGLSRLAVKLSSEHDNLLIQIEQWEELSKMDNSLIEGEKIAKLEELVKKIRMKKELEMLEEQEEEPIVLILLYETGIPIYSKNFAMSQEIDDMLVAGFISAINNFIQDAFGVSGYIDRIKHKENTILIKHIESMFICYVFKGGSYAASSKLERFIKEINNSPILDYLQDSEMITKGFSQSEINRVETMIENIFPAN